MPTLRPGDQLQFQRFERGYHHGCNADQPVQKPVHAQQPAASQPAGSREAANGNALKGFADRADSPGTGIGAITARKQCHRDRNLAQLLPDASGRRSGSALEPGKRPDYRRQARLACSAKMRVQSGDLHLAGRAIFLPAINVLLTLKS